MSGDLIERVARAIALVVEDDPDEWELYAPPASAAIRVVVEECARECERYAREYPDDEQRWDVAFEIAAAAIRALLEDGK